mmetsp:Transcript_10105/g.14823  ORF Transcript_10105/g.14823 Transcript_10105/m.14823 type:complete len:873 (+) Transcript_10105:124-2742(+)
MSDDQIETCDRELKGEEAIKVIGGLWFLYEFRRATELENLTIIILILILSVIILSRRRAIFGTVLGKRKQGNYYGGEEATSATTNSTSSTFCHQTIENLSDEALFEKNWPAIRISRYRRLVLPPECKVIDVPVFVWKQESEEDTPKEIKRDSKTNVEEDEQPLARLANYGRSLFCHLQEFVRFDYFGLGSIIRRISELWTLVKFKNPGSKQEEQAPHKIEPNSDEIQGSPFVRKEKKDYIQPGRSVSFKCGSPMKRSCSDSFYDTSVDDENDIGERPLLSALDLSSPLIGGITPSSKKKRDFLEKYLSQPNLPLHHYNAEQSVPQIPDLTERDGNRYHNVGFSIDEVSKSESMPSFDATESMTFFDAAQTKATLRKLHVDVPVPDRNGYILGDDFLPNNRHTPLLVFVNSRSGPRQGQILIHQLRRLLNPIQVWDLADGGPKTVLESFSKFSRLRILVCGGDGTVSWVISCLEKMKPEKRPPIAILPLGTGNDLARIHGWGGGYSNESLIAILEQVSESYISLLDQWEMEIENKKGKVVGTKPFFNYAGIGADAQAALQVHMLRESKPQLFFSRIFNKVWYLIFGAEEAIKESNINLPNEITLIADGVEVPLPPDSQGVILLNIDSYLGGVPMWSLAVKESSGTPPNSPKLLSPDVSDRDTLDPNQSPRRRRSTGNILKENAQYIFDRMDSMEDLQAHNITEGGKYSQVFACDGPSSCQDGKLDIISIRGTFHLGQIQVGLGNGYRLCQAKEVEVIIKKKLAVQIDGEPWLQNECRMKITRKKDAAVMLHRSPFESGGVETEMAKLLDWAEDRKVINRDVHTVLMKEFSRRIENKSRERRVRSQDNLMLTLRRAIGSTTSNSISTFPGSLSF